MIVATVTLTSSVKPQLFPAGTIGGAWRFIITDAAGTPFSQDVSEPTATFSNVADGNYVATVQRLDDDGTALGDIASVNFTVSAGGGGEVSISVPDVLSVEIKP
jgi:hypothetical protein